MQLGLKLSELVRKTKPRYYIGHKMLEIFICSSMVDPLRKASRRAALAGVQSPPQAQTELHQMSKKKGKVSSLSCKTHILPAVTKDCSRENVSSAARNQVLVSWWHLKVQIAI